MLGQATGSPKPFVGLLLVLWYVAGSDKGRTPALDVAGFGGAATPGSVGGWLGVAILLAGAALLLERFRLSRG
ncbi:MAG: hypothetical protein IPP07_16145 [Holophagales bacterium]|nr:hypothetical protein [Holophagales bacterium]